MNEAKMDRFWRWYVKVSLGGRHIWLRTLSTADDGARSKASMDKARKARARLMADGSDERVAMFSAYDALDRDTMMATISAYDREMLRAASYNEVHPDDPPKPAGNTLTDVLDAEDKAEQAQQTLVEKREKYVEEHVETLKGERAKMSDDELRDLILEMEIAARSTQAYADEFDRQTVFRACYDDEKFTRKTFSTPDEVGEIGIKAYRTLTDEYRKLDNFAQDPDALKN